MKKDAEIDEAIFASILPRWQKVAMIIAKASQILGVDGEENYKLIARRIELLVRKGKLDSQGDVKNWRFSEIRLPKT